MHKTNVFILDLNKSDCTISCIDKVLYYNKTNINIHVLLNGSNEHHKKVIKQHFNNESNIYIYESEKNLGFCGGVNHLFNESFAAGIISDDILLLNNDAFIEANTINRLVAVLSSEKDIGIVAPRVLQANNKSLISEDGVNYFHWFMQHTPINSGKKLKEVEADGVQEMPVLNGTCMLIKTRVFKELGGFDENFFAYFEDWDLCLRAKKIGYKTVHVRDAVVSHIGSASSGKKTVNYQFLMTRNRYIIARKHLKFPVFHFVFVPYFIISRIIIKSLLLSLSYSHTGIKGIFLALCWLLLPKKVKSQYWPIENSKIPCMS